MKQSQRFRAWKLAPIAAATALATFSASASAAQAAPVPSTTTVRAIPSSPDVFQPTTLDVRATCAQGVAGGTGITFFDGPTLLDTIPVDAAGRAVLVTAFSIPGPHEITAVYYGNLNCGASSAMTTVNVSPTSACPPRKPPAMRATSGRLAHCSPLSVSTGLMRAPGRP